MVAIARVIEFPPAAAFHRKNARAWASAATGEDLTGQIDPEFTLGPHALAMAGA